MIRVQLRRPTIRVENTFGEVGEHEKRGFDMPRKQAVLSLPLKRLYAAFLPIYFNCGIRTEKRT
jgi:hypothetical protein